ncbi:MAG: type IV secretory system conjugative DNA transfer family protein, partial [Actinomycetota bacterium]|nr:type IV secretory system conjugative DNA transfer family protein [Actinomycetota bacterium]
MSPDSIGRRRPDPLPWTWEVPVGAGLAWLSLSAAMLLAGQGTAGFVTGHGWLWPGSPRLFPALGGLLTGQVGVGVDAPAGLPAPALVYLLAVVLELALLALSVWAGVRFWSTVGPGRRHGMATRADAETVLGVGRLRRVRTLIRPDVYGRPGRRRDVVTVMARPSRLAGRRLASRSSGQATHAAVLAGDAPAQRRSRFTPASVGWRLGVGKVPRTGPLWVPFDRTTGVYGPQGSGKTLDLLTPALLAAPGAALVTLTKVEDLLLTVDHRSSGGRPVAVLDPFGLAPGLPELVWDPVAGCVDSMVAER